MVGDELHIKIICVGKINESIWGAPSREYLKRLRRYARMELVNVKDDPLPSCFSAAEVERVRNEESERIFKNIKKNEYLIGLHRRGKSFTSEEFAFYLEELRVSGFSDLVFIIGGTLGLSENCLQRCRTLLSLSRLTFPHQLSLVILLEQLFRTFKIIRSEPYHY